MQLSTQQLSLWSQAGIPTAADVSASSALRPRLEAVSVLEILATFLLRLSAEASSFPSPGYPSSHSFTYRARVSVSIINSSVYPVEDESTKQILDAEPYVSGMQRRGKRENAVVHRGSHIA